MLGEVVYTPPKNKYPQYKKSDFDILTYAHMWANHRQFIMGYDQKMFRDVMSKLSETPMGKIAERSEG